MYRAHRFSMCMPIGSFSLALALTACEGTGAPTDSSSLPIGGYIERFPHKVGTRWVYSVVDSRQNRTDTIEVLIEALVETTDTSRTWRWTFESLYDNILWPDYNVTITDSRVMFRPLDDDPTRHMMLEFPICPDSIWRYGQMTSFVQEVETLYTALGQVVTMPVQSIWLYGCLSCNYWYEHWYVPEIGFVRMVRAEGVNSLDTYQVWELLEWHPGRIPLKHQPGP